MPGLSGREVMERIHAEDSVIPFLFSSGYSSDAVHANFVAGEGVRLIQKPYRKEDLLAEVRLILDARSCQES
ncbi:MAG: response regulator, partial [FCB group bacterium]|jgi:CheY-like chemotaxis protein|nr:response regulator [FCB group bacterium]